MAPSSSPDLPRVILLLVTDQLRYDAFDPSITPHLHALAQTSTTFSNAYCSTPTCTPSRAALLTGKSPWNHGMLGHRSQVDCRGYPTTLPRVLDDLGYATKIAGKNHFGAENEQRFVSHGYRESELYEGLTRFDGRDPDKPTDDYHKFFHEGHPDVDALSSCNLGVNDWESCCYGFDEYYHPTSWTTRRALDYIDEFFEEQGEGDDGEMDRMFLKVSYHRPHSPYDPPKRFFDKHQSLKHLDKYGRNIIGDDGWDAEYLNTTEMKSYDYHGDPGDDLARRSRAAYYANVEFVDEGIGSILSALDERNALDDAFVVWTTDHGDMNGDHNLWRKGYPWEGASHVPMMMKLPRQSVGGVSDAIVETRDVAPTIYDAVGALQDVTSKDPLVNGRSLLPILNGERSGVRDMLDLEHSTLYHDERIHWNAIVGFRGNELFKYVFFASSGKEQLFNLSVDPKERHDLASQDNAEHEFAVTYWREAMARQFQREGRGDAWVGSDGALVVGREAVKYGPNYPCPITAKSLRSPADVAVGLAIE